MRAACMSLLAGCCAAPGEQQHEKACCACLPPSKQLEQSCKRAQDKQVYSLPTMGACNQHLSLLNKGHITAMMFLTDEISSSSGMQGIHIRRSMKVCRCPR